MLKFNFIPASVATSSISVTSTVCVLGSISTCVSPYQSTVNGTSFENVVSFPSVSTNVPENVTEFSLLYFVVSFPIALVLLYEFE